MSKPTNVEWRYLYKGKSAHALRRSRDYVAVCGVAPTWFASWYGTGSQTEYETVEALPACKRCIKLI